MAFSFGAANTANLPMPANINRLAITPGKYHAGFNSFGFPKAYVSDGAAAPNPIPRLIQVEQVFVQPAMATPAAASLAAAQEAGVMFARLTRGLVQPLPPAMMQSQGGAAIGTYPGQTGVYVSAIDYAFGGNFYRHYFVVFDCDVQAAAAWTRNFTRRVRAQFGRMGCMTNALLTGGAAVNTANGAAHALMPLAFQSHGNHLTTAADMANMVLINYHLYDDGVSPPAFGAIEEILWVAHRNLQDHPGLAQWSGPVEPQLTTDTLQNGQPGYNHLVKAETKSILDLARALTPARGGAAAGTWGP